MNKMLNESRNIKEQIINWRRTIHRRPELGFDVYKTAELVLKSLGEMGIEAQPGVGRTGVLGFIGSQPGPTIAIRADMDALPIQEQNEVEYISQVPGSMHACGHDSHTAMLLGAARLLSQIELPGQVRLIFQPSEETFDENGVSGAPVMIADGALEGVDAVIALHVHSTAHTGTILLDDGVVGAAVDTFKGYVVGKGGHGAYPHQTLDPIWMATHVLNALYAIPSRRIKPIEPCVVTVGIIQAGTAENIIPDEVYIEGTLRSYSEAVRESLLEEVERAFSHTRTFGGDYRVSFEHGYPPQNNDPRVAGWLRQVAADLLGGEAVLGGQKSMGAEDFAYMTQVVPGAMFGLGIRPEGAQPRHLHTAKFDLEEEALPLGSAILAETARRFLYGELIN